MDHRLMDHGPDQIAQVSKVLGAYGELFTDLADPRQTEALLGAFRSGEGARLMKLVGDRPPFTAATCIDIVRTLTAAINTGEWNGREVCEIPNVLRPPSPSTTNGKYYRMPDGRYVFVSEAEWFDLLDRAVAEPDWREANHELLQVVGILVCTWQLIPSVQIVTIEQSQTLCFGRDQ
jgi:hypothetical protein